LKILQVISGKTVNGAMTYCKFVSEQLTALGHEVTIVGRPDGWIKNNVDSSIQFLASELSRSPSEIGRVAKWVKANQIDVVHTHMSRGHAFGVLLRLITGVPVVATAHNQSFQLHWRMNDYVIANSQATYNYQRRINRVANRQMETVHCFTDLERFKHVKPLDVTIVRRQMRLQGDEFLVGVVGEVVARKGHLFLFEALSRVVKEVPNLKLVLLGRFNRNEAYVKKLRAIQLRDKIFCHVKWLGLRWNIQDFMVAFDLTVVPSVEEPLGLVALESMAAGTPVVASHTGGLPEIVRPGENGWLVPPRDPVALADAIIKMATASESERQRLGENGRKMVQAEFDPQLLTRQVEDIFQRVVAARRAA
jgi:glycosyltransferase involved in cell wall biosynthesis